MLLLHGCPALAAAPTEFCLEGAFNLGARNQGTSAGESEFFDATWCVVTEDDSEQVLFSATGRSNPDLEGSWRVAYLPPDAVRIVRPDRPDILFEGADSRDDARRNRRIDPRRLAEERRGGPLEDLDVEMVGGRVTRVRTEADLPLRGRVPVVWDWDWSDAQHPSLVLRVDGEVFFRARGHWRALDAGAPAGLAPPAAGEDVVTVSGDNWPARIDMRLEQLADGVHLVTGVRTGFRHLVVETGEGLVVADAPTGWVELHQLPPVDLVPGLGISGLSERMIDFLREQGLDQPVRAVALTHHHDDHAGGARAFAAAGGRVYAPATSAGFLAEALASEAMPEDRLARQGASVEVVPVAEPRTLADAERPVRLVPLGAGPHTDDALGIHLPEQGIFFVSDVHVPNSDADVPRPERAATECWFADWAVAHLPAGVRVHNSHSGVATPVSRLERYLESGACQRVQREG